MEEVKEKKGFFKRLREGLSKTRNNIAESFNNLFKASELDDDFYDELEETLVMSDMGFETTEKIINDLEVVTPSANTPVRRLSGGNVQKVLVGREIAAAPTVLMAAYPVRGLDINSSYTIYNLLNKQKENGAAVLFVGEDLDVLMALCDRIMVIASGKITGIVDGRSITKEELGLLMTKTTSINEEKQTLTQEKGEDGNEKAAE